MSIEVKKKIVSARNRIAQNWLRLQVPSRLFLNLSLALCLALSIPLLASVGPEGSVSDGEDDVSVPGVEEEASGEYEVRWGTVDSAGTPMEMSGGGFGLSSTAGQPEVTRSSGGAFVWSGGFWPVIAEESEACSAEKAIFCDGFESGDTSAWTEN